MNSNAHRQTPGTVAHRLEPALGALGAVGRQLKGKFIWIVELGARPNYSRLGKRLAAIGGLFRYRGGLVRVFADKQPVLIAKAADLAPLIADHIRMRVEKDGKTVSELPTASHLACMLRSEAFLGQFTEIDMIASTPVVGPDFSFSQPGFNDFGPGRR